MLLNIYLLQQTLQLCRCQDLPLQTGGFEQGRGGSPPFGFTRSTHFRWLNCRGRNQFTSRYLLYNRKWKIQIVRWLLAWTCINETTLGYVPNTVMTLTDAKGAYGGHWRDFITSPAWRVWIMPSGRGVRVTGIKQTLAPTSSFTIHR